MRGCRVAGVRRYFARALQVWRESPHRPSAMRATVAAVVRWTALGHYHNVNAGFYRPAGGESETYCIPRP
jgi:hypothetical protein